MTEKQFEVTISSNNRVHFTENGIDVISIGFNEYSDAVNCKNELLPFCNRLNNLSEENKVFDKKLTKYIVNYNGLNCEYNWLNTENEQIKKDLKIILPLLLAIDFKISINECKAINRLCKLVEDDFIKSKELNKVVEKKEYPKRNPITYESVPEAIYNWDD